MATTVASAEARALDGLARIANDPGEAPERRAKAKAVLDRHFGTDHHLLISPYESAVASRSVMGSPGRHRTSGGDGLHADAEYDGWNTQR